MDFRNIICALILFYFVYTICNQQYEYFIKSRDPILRELYSKLSVLHPKFKQVELYEGNQSYTLNKRKIYICLKDENGKYYHDNMLVYVICHEYAHILCNEIGHTKKFFAIFDQLLAKAVQMGYYNPNIPPLKNYCGVTD